MSIVLQGSTSGSITLQEPAVAGTTVLTLPTTSGTLITTGTTGQVIASGALPIGSVLQVANFQTGTLATGSTAIPFDNTIPQITEGDEYMSLAFTPKFSTSKLKIDVVWQGTNTTVSAAGLVIALFMVGTSNALAATFNSVASSCISNFVFTHYMTSGTTSAITFKVRAGSSNGGTTSFNGQSGSANGGGVLASSITISEIAA